MIQLFLLNLTGPDALQPGEYAVTESDRVPAEPPLVTLCCPICGEKRELNEAHHITESGRVRPAFACRACPLLEWIQLSDWDVAA